MNNVEKRLAEEKKRIDSITAPEELELRLRSALNTATTKKDKRIAPIWMLTAVALFLMFIVGYQYNAFAFYGKKLLGFDEVITGTLKELNDEGMGQIIEKKTELGDGTELTINGMMTDANQLVMYYTITNPNGIEDSASAVITSSNITGFLTNSIAVSGTTSMNENRTEIKGAMSFEPVNPFSKKLTLHFSEHLQNDQLTVESISFPYNPNKAMQTVIKQSIKKKLQVDKGTISFNSITATQTLTVIEGSVNVENFNRVDFALGGIELIANGKRIDLMGSGSQSSLRGNKFDISYDALPEKLDSLDLVMKEFVGYKLLKEKVPLASIGNEPIMLDGKELWVKDVSTTADGVEITIATDDEVMLDEVSIETQKESTSLRTTVNQLYTKQKDGKEMKERTLLFDTKVKPEYLLIEGMHYMKTYNNVIKIPIE